MIEELDRGNDLDSFSPILKRGVSSLDALNPVPAVAFGAPLGNRTASRCFWQAALRPAPVGANVWSVWRCTERVRDEEAVPTHLFGQYLQIGRLLDLGAAVEG